MITEDKAIEIIERIRELSLRKNKLELRIDKLRTRLARYMESTEQDEFMGAKFAERVTVEVTDPRVVAAVIVEQKRFELVANTIPIAAYRDYVRDSGSDLPGVTVKQKRILYVGK